MTTRRRVERLEQAGLAVRSTRSLSTWPSTSRITNSRKPDPSRPDDSVARARSYPTPVATRSMRSPSRAAASSSIRPTNAARHEVGDVHAEDVRGVLRGGEDAGVPLAGVAPEAREQGTPGRPLAEEVGLVERDQLAALHLAAVDGPGGVPGGQVQQRYGQLLRRRPVVAGHRLGRKHEARHRQHGQPRVEPARPDVRLLGKNSRDSGSSAMSRR